MYLFDLCTLPSLNLAGHCGMSVPRACRPTMTSPVGLQIRRADDRLYRGRCGLRSGPRRTAARA